MSDLGLGVMINMLGGNEKSVEVFKGALNKIIIGLSLDDDILHFTFEDGYKMDLADDGQSCCEHRYITTDDNLQYFCGAKFMDAEIKEAPNIADEYGEHEVQFLEIKTSKGVFTLETHNEHNGYYGGFWVVAKKIEEEAECDSSK